MTKKNVNPRDLKDYLRRTGQIIPLMMKYGGIENGIGKDHSQPCPFCGGTDRFWYSSCHERFFCRDPEKNECLANKGVDVLFLVQHKQRMSFRDALQFIAHKSGYTTSTAKQETKSIPTEDEPTNATELQTFELAEDSYYFRAVQKFRPEIDYATYQRAGVVGFRYGIGGMALPMFDNEGKMSGYVRYLTDGTKKNSMGSKSGIVGVDARDALLSKRQAKMIFKCAGVSDYLVVSKVIAENGLEADYYAFTNGAGEMENPDKFALILRPALEDQIVAVLQDNDEAGEAGAQKWAGHFAIFAKDVRIIPPPQEFNDFRDFLSASNASEVLRWIETEFENAKPITPNTVATPNQSESAADESEPQKPWQPFPLETLPCQLQIFVIETSQSIGIDASNTAACVLSIVSGIIGRTFQLKIKQGYNEHAMLWVVLVAESGFGKSPALDYARKPIDRLQTEALEKYEEEKIQYDIDLEDYKQYMRNRKKNEPASFKPVEPVMACYSVSDFTTEALLPVLSENPYGVGLIRDEIAAFFGSLDAYRGAKMDRQILIEIHGGRFAQKHRATGKRHLAAKTPSLSIVGGIQSDVIRQVIKDEPDFLTTGFGARFLMVYPPAEPILWNDNVAAETALLSYDKLIDDLLKCREHFTPEEPGVISLSPEATALIFAFQNQHADDSLGIADGNVRYVENKAGMHCARLTLVLHIIHCIENNIDPLTQVTSETMQQAVALTEWFLNEAHRIYAMFAGKTEPIDSEDEILTRIDEWDGEMSIDDFRRSFTKYHQAGGTAALKQRLQEMLDAGLLSEREGESARGRKRKYYSRRKQSCDDDS